MAASTIQTGFAAGEIAPNLYARVDLEKYKVGAAKLRNWLVDFRGGAFTRPGTRYLGKAFKNVYPPRLIPFIVSTIASYSIEVGANYFRFYSNQGQVVEAATTISGVTKANPGVITDAGHGYSNGDEIIISGIVGMTQLNGKNFLVAGVTTNTYTLTDLFGNVISTSAYGTYISGGSAARIYTLTTPYAGADLAGLKYTQSADVMTITHPNYVPMQLSRVTASSFSLSSFVVGAQIAAPTGLSCSYIQTGENGAAFTVEYQVTAVSSLSNEESLPSQPVAVQFPGFNQPTSSVTTTLAWTAPSENVAYYNIYKAGGYTNNGQPQASVFGYIGRALSPSFTECSPGTSPDFTKTPPLHNDPFAANQITSISVSGGGTYAADTFYVPLTFTGGGGSGAVGYAILAGTAVVSAVLIDPGSGYTSAPTITAGSGGATFTSTQSGAATGYVVV